MAFNTASDYFKIETRPDQVRLRNPGDVSLIRIERVNGIFMVTYRWMDMVHILHEKTFERGDLFTNFPKVLKAMTDLGLPFDLSKTEEFKQDLCKMTNFVYRQNQGKPVETQTQNQETKPAPSAETPSS